MNQKLKDKVENLVKTYNDDKSLIIALIKIRAPQHYFYYAAKMKYEKINRSIISYN